MIMMIGGYDDDDDMGDGHNYRDMMLTNCFTYSAIPSLAALLSSLAISLFVPAVLSIFR